MISIALRGAGAFIDVVPAHPEAVQDRRLVLAPGLFTADDALVDALRHSGAVVLLGPRAGSKTPDFQIPMDLPPGKLRTLVDVSVTRAESLRPGAAIEAEGAGAFRRWREYVTPGRATVEWRTCDGAAGLIRGDGGFYLAGWPDAALMAATLRRLFECAGMPWMTLPEGLRLQDHGKRRYFFNYGMQAADLRPFISDRRFLLGSETLEACGVAVTESPLS